MNRFFESYSSELEPLSGLSVTEVYCNIAGIIEHLLKCLNITISMISYYVYPSLFLIGYISYHYFWHRCESLGEKHRRLPKIYPLNIDIAPKSALHTTVALTLTYVLENLLQIGSTMMATSGTFLSPHAMSVYEEKYIKPVDLIGIFIDIIFGIFDSWYTYVSVSNTSQIFGSWVIIFFIRLWYQSNSLEITALTEYSIFKELKQDLALPAIDALCESFFFLTVKIIQTVVKIVIRDSKRYISETSQTLHEYFNTGTKFVDNYGRQVDGKVYIVRSFVIENTKRNTSIDIVQGELTGWSSWIKFPDATLFDYLLGFIDSVSKVHLLGLCATIYVVNTVFNFFNLSKTLTIISQSRISGPWLVLLVGVAITHLLILCAVPWVYYEKFQSQSMRIKLSDITEIAKDLYSCIYPLDKLICCMLATDVHNNFWEYTKHYFKRHKYMYWIFLPFNYIIKRFICNLYIYLPAVGIKTPHHFIVLFMMGLTLTELTNHKGKGITASHSLKFIKQHHQVLVGIMLIFTANIIGVIKESKVEMTLDTVLKFSWNFIREDLEYSAWTFMTWNWLKEPYDEPERSSAFESFIGYSSMSALKVYILEAIDTYTGPDTIQALNYRKLNNQSFSAHEH